MFFSHIYLQIRVRCEYRADGDYCEGFEIWLPINGVESLFFCLLDTVRKGAPKASTVGFSLSPHLIAVTNQTVHASKVNTWGDDWNYSLHFHCVVPDNGPQLEPPYSGRTQLPPSTSAGGEKKNTPHKSLLNKTHCSGLRATLTDPEALPGERVGRLAVLGDQRGVAALLAGILAVALQADPLADERSDDHFEALPCQGALDAPRQPVDAQPDDKQTGDQRGHPGILRCPPQTPGDLRSQAPAQSAALLTEAEFSGLIRWRRWRRRWWWWGGARPP